MKNSLFGLGALMLVSACGFEVVDTGRRGVETRFGKVVGESLGEGLHFYNPVTSNIVEMDVREKNLDVSTEAYSKDTQVVSIKATTNLHLDRGTVHLVFQEVGTSWSDTLVPQIIHATIKDKIGEVDAGHLITERSMVVGKIKDALIEKLAEKRVHLVSFEISNIDFDDAFEAAVRNKVVAVEKAKAAQNETVKIKEEAAQKVITAKADAESMKIRSQALSQNKNLVEYEAVQKWDGVLPQYMLGGSAPFISLPHAVKK